MRIDSILFDLDGTIIDSLPGIQRAFELTMMEILPSYQIPDLRYFIGPPIREIFCKLFKDLSEQEIDTLVSCFRRKYDQETCIMANVYPEVHETLSFLAQKGIKCFIITNKPITPTRRILKYSGLDNYFQTVISPDVKTPPFRNKKEMAIFAVKEYQLNPTQTLFVGDSEEDQKAAQESGTIFVAAAYGYGKIIVIDQIGRRSTLSTLSDLLLIIGSEDKNLY